MKVNFPGTCWSLGLWDRPDMPEMSSLGLHPGTCRSLGLRETKSRPDMPEMSLLDYALLRAFVALCTVATNCGVFVWPSAQVRRKDMS